MSKIAELWSNRVIEGKRTYEEVPAKLKDEVAKILTEQGYSHLINPTT